MECSPSNKAIIRVCKCTPQKWGTKKLAFSKFMGKDHITHLNCLFRIFVNHTFLPLNLASRTINSVFGKNYTRICGEGRKRKGFISIVWITAGLG